MILLTLTFLVSAAFSQFATSLHSLSRCFNNCLHCDHNELALCIGKSEGLCVENYYQSGSECNLDKTYYDQKTLIDKNGEFKELEKWELFQSIECSYLKSNGETQGVSVLGLLEASATNTLKIAVKPFYQSMLMSFSLVRNSWVPYMDFLQIEFKDNTNRSLGKYIIEYLERSDYTADNDHIITCNDQKLVVENFQVNLDFKHRNISRILVQMKGLMNGEELWGFTDVKIAFGCRNNLFFNSNSCHNCQPGYYIDSNTTVDGAPICAKCPYKCATCNAQKCFTCIEGIQLIASQCQPASGFKMIEKVSLSDAKQYCHIQMMMGQQSHETGKHSIEGIVIPVKQSHREARLIFQLYLSDSQWDKQSVVIVEVDGREIKRIKQDSVHGRLRENCSSFTSGFYSSFSIVTSYFDHSTSSMNVRIYSTDVTIVSLALGDMHVEIQLQQPKVEIIPIPVPQPVPRPQPLPLPTVQPKPQTKVQPPKPIAVQPKIEQIQDNESSVSLVIRDQISKLEPHIGQISLSHTTFAQPSAKVSSNELLVSINYPIDIKHYPYIYCYFQGLGVELPGRMVSSTSHLQYVAVQILQSLVNQTVAVSMSAKQKSLSKHIGKRMLEVLQKRDEVELGRILIQRFDVLQANELSGLQSFKLFFVILAHIILVSTILLALVGKLHYIGNLSLLVQLLFLHSYIHAQFLPLSYRIPISGLQSMENLNYFAKQTQTAVESGLMGNVVQDSPIRFMEFNVDINFTRAFYPLLLVNALYLLWFLLLLALRKAIAAKSKQKQNQGVEMAGNQAMSGAQAGEQQPRLARVQSYLESIVLRPLNYWHQVFRYQFLAMVWICFLQFYNLEYPPGADRNPTINAVLCISAFVWALLLPIAIYVWTRRAYLKLPYEQYIGRFNQIFLFQLYSQSLPSHQHHYYLLLEPLRWLICALCCSFLGISPLQSLIILVVTHALSVGYLRWARPVLDCTQVRLSYAIFGLLICLQVCMLAAFGANNVASKVQYLALGYVMITVTIVTVCLGFCQMAYRIYKDLNQPSNEDMDFNGELAAKRIV